jgi:type IV secretory pathway VirB10-like protein
VFILKYFVFVGLSLLSVLFAVDLWVGSPARLDTSPSAATAALIAMARRGDRASEFPVREERPVPKAATNRPSPETPDQTVSDRPAPAIADLKRVSEARAEMVAPETVAPKAATHRTATSRRPARQVKSKVAHQNSRARIRVVENATRRSADPFALFGSW